MALSVVGFAIGLANIFLGSMANAMFLNVYGTYGTAVITHEEETSSQLNDANIWEYDAVVRTADGQDVKTGFDTMSASLYPPRNAIEIPPKGERFVVKYIPGYERNIAIMRDESPFGKRLLLRRESTGKLLARQQNATSPPSLDDGGLDIARDSRSPITFERALSGAWRSRPGWLGSRASPTPIPNMWVRKISRTRPATDYALDEPQRGSPHPVAPNVGL